MTLQECFAVLELAPGASWEDVKKARRQLATVWHPDRFMEDSTLRGRAELQLNRINSAFIRLKEHFESSGRASTAPQPDDGADPVPPAAEAEERASGPAESRPNRPDPTASRTVMVLAGGLFGMAVGAIVGCLVGINLVAAALAGVLPGALVGLVATRGDPVSS